MNDKKLKQLFDFQKFEGNSAMDSAIKSARSYIDSLQNQPVIVELGDGELDMLNAAGNPGDKLVAKNEAGEFGIRKF